MSDRKRRGDAFEQGLSGNAFIELRDGLLGNWTYKAAKAWLLTEHRTEVSEAALGSFWEFYCAPILSDRRKMAARKAEEIARLSHEEKVDWSAAAMDRLQQLTFEFCLEAKEEVDSKAVARLMRLVLADKALNHDARKLALMEEKMERARAELETAVERAKEGGLSQEALELMEEAVGLL